MFANIKPTKNLDVFPMMDEILQYMWKNSDSDIGVPDLDDKDNLLVNGIRLEYREDKDLLNILTSLNKEKFSYNITHENG